MWPRSAVHLSVVVTSYHQASKLAILSKKNWPDIKAELFAKWSPTNGNKQNGYDNCNDLISAGFVGKGASKIPGYIRGSDPSWDLGKLQKVDWFQAVFDPPLVPT